MKTFAKHTTLTAIMHLWYDIPVLWKKEDTCIKRE